MTGTSASPVTVREARPEEGPAVAALLRESYVAFAAELPPDLLRAASTFPGQSGPRCPSPTNSSAPISERTMLWQKASARTVAVMIPSSPFTRLRSRSVRIVVAPSRLLQ